jgi:hypothetical protein
MAETLTTRASPGAPSEFHTSNWIQVHLFTDMFQHFLHKCKQTDSSPVLRIVHGNNVTYRPTARQLLDKHIPAETDSW